MTPDQDMIVSEARLREILAAHLCEEYDVEFFPTPGASWPEDENDDGKREGGYIAIQPKHTQARAREIADRILSLLALRPKEAGQAGDWVLVPREPTVDMEQAHYEAHARAETVFAEFGALWSAIISAAPKPNHMGGKLICDTLGFDPTNHHNAAKCPYCNPADTSPPGETAQVGELDETGLQAAMAVIAARIVGGDTIADLAKPVILAYLSASSLSAKEAAEAAALEEVEGFGASFIRGDDAWHFYTMPGVKPFPLVLRGFDRQRLDFVMAALRTSLSAKESPEQLREAVIEECARVAERDGSSHDATISQQTPEWHHATTIAVRAADRIAGKIRALSTGGGQ